MPFDKKVQAQGRCYFRVVSWLIKTSKSVCKNISKVLYNKEEILLEWAMLSSVEFETPNHLSFYIFLSIVKELDKKNNLHPAYLFVMFAVHFFTLLYSIYLDFAYDSSNHRPRSAVTPGWKLACKSGWNMWKIPGAKDCTGKKPNGQIVMLRKHGITLKIWMFIRFVITEFYGSFWWHIIMWY